MDSASVKQCKADKGAITEHKNEKDVQYCERCHANRTLDQLPCEIIEKILEFLSPNDLAEISATCHRLRDAARKHYQLKRRCGSVTIDTFSYHHDSDFMEEKDIYKIRFRNLIPNVKVIFRNDKRVADTIKFIKGNCYKHLKALKLENKTNTWAENFTLNNLNIIADQIESVEFLILDDRIIDFPWNLFTNLRALSSNRIIFIDQFFPKLRTLCLIEEGGWGYSQSGFVSFLRNNTKLKSIYCKKFKADIHRCVLSTEFKLTSVVLSFQFEIDLERILDNMQECSDRKTIDSVEIHYLRIPHDILQRLGRMENVKHIHSSTFYGVTSDNIYFLPYVQRLCIEDSNLESSTLQGWNTFFKRFPNLEKLRLNFFRTTVPMIGDMISSIIASLPKLKYLHCFNLRRKDILRNIQEWKRIRSSLKNVKNSLNMHFDSSRAMSNGVWCPICCESDFETIAYMDILSE